MSYCARASLLVTAALLTTSCSDTDARLFATQPSKVGTSLAVVETASSTAVAEPVSNSFCPSVTPFSVRLAVIIRPTGPVDVVVTGIRMTFTDRFGRQAPQVTAPMLPVTLTAPGPALQFGTSQAGSVRTFPLTLGIGCGTDNRGTVLIVVDMSDGQGRRVEEQVKVAVH